MAEQGKHCPFLEQDDARCSTHFRLDHIRHAFKYCFGRHSACPLYLQLRVEARVAKLGCATAEADLERNRNTNPPTTRAAISHASGG